jgi:hypothetical protein
MIAGSFEDNRAVVDAATKKAQARLDKRTAAFIREDRIAGTSR